MPKSVNRQIILKRRPQGLPKPEDFDYREVPLQAPKDGQVLLRNVYLSLDPAIRGWMDGREDSYQPPIPLGHVMRAVTIAEVVDTRNTNYSPGDFVMGLNGWEDYSISTGTGFINKIPADNQLPLSVYLSVLGTTGLTAYFGLLDVGKPQQGETVLVSAAAGAVGSVVGQIAKIKGCRTVGIAGGAEKCAQLVDTFGFDEAIDYKSTDSLEMEIKRTCPSGIDVYFDNVGGGMLEAALNCLKNGARIVMCGAISTYNATGPVPGPSGLWQLLVHNARLEGFIVSKYASQFPEGVSQLADWLREGSIKHKEHIVPGLRNASDAFLKLFSGKNVGKLIVQMD